jgi:hypothetical protein
VFRPRRGGSSPWCDVLAQSTDSLGGPALKIRLPRSGIADSHPERPAGLRTASSDSRPANGRREQSASQVRLSDPGRPPGPTEARATTQPVPT